MPWRVIRVESHNAPSSADQSHYCWAANRAYVSLTRKMPVTKQYSYTISFDRGTAEVTDKYAIGTLMQVVVRAECIIPEQRIFIETHDDPADPFDVGAAMRRLDALRQYLVAKSFDAQRLEMQVHAGNCCTGTPSEFARRAEIHLFQRVTSLCHGAGDQFLSYTEVCGLESAWEATFLDDLDTKKLECRYTTVEWKRMLGHESLRKWIEAGAYHPYFASVDLHTHLKGG